MDMSTCLERDNHPLHYAAESADIKDGDTDHYKSGLDCHMASPFLWENCETFVVSETIVSFPV